MLTATERDNLREALNLEKQRLLKSAHEGLAFAMNRDRESVGRDSIDESMEEEIFSTELRLRDRERGLLGKITGAHRTHSAAAGHGTQSVPSTFCSQLAMA